MRVFKALMGVVIFFILLALLFLYGFSGSYKKSLEAKMKYMMGDYDRAMILAREAFDEDPYNRMAISILAQSKISVKIADYISDGEKYLKKIKSITKKESITSADKSKIKMMCEVMIGRYKKLAPTVMTDKDLTKRAKEIYREFKTIYEELFQKKS
jgi:tetratricopeptide (TPR) repeat protein